jgi:hypothetical protein
MTEQRGSHVPMVVSLSLLLALVLYVGSYLALVRPTAGKIDGPFGPRPYSFGGAYAARLYWPMEQLDRRVLPARWRSIGRNRVLFRDY